MEKFIEQKLLNAGWYQNRKQNLDNVKLCFQNEGYNVNFMAEQFFANYLGLTIPIKDLQNNDDEFNVDPAFACNITFPDRKIEYEELLNKGLTIIGMIYKKHMTVFLSEDGCFYGGFDDILVLFGQDIETFFFNIMTGEVPININQ